MNTKYWIFGLFLFFFSCSEKELAPISGSLGKPGIVTDVIVEPISGGASISYKIPNTEDLLEVKCLYTTANDKKCEVSVSYFENKLQIQGYNDTQEHTAVLYVVNRAQELSDPVEVKFRPLESSLNKAIKSAKIEADFGGARFTWKNEEKAPLNIEFFGPDTTGQMNTLNIMASDIVDNLYNIRGYESKPTQFSMIINDNYGNYSDTISAEVIPLHERKLDKKKMKVMCLGNDSPFNEWGYLDAYIIDDDIMMFGHTANNALPATFTIDLGETTKLSRFVFHQRLKHESGSNISYGHGNPKTLEVYTCDHLPSNSGDWSEWTKIMNCEIEKPSGSPGTSVTDLDLEAAEEGHSFSFDFSQPPMRYVRIKVTSTWDGATYTAVGEVTFFGAGE